MSLRATFLDVPPTSVLIFLTVIVIGGKLESFKVTGVFNLEQLDIKMSPRGKRTVLYSIALL